MLAIKSNISLFQLINAAAITFSSQRKVYMKPLINFFVVHQTDVGYEKLGHDRSLLNVCFHISTKKPFHFPGLRLYFLDSRIQIEKTPFFAFCASGSQNSKFCLL